MIRFYNQLFLLSINKMSIFKYDEISIKKINYNKPETKGSFYYSSMNYDNKPLHIQSPKMKCTCSGDQIIQKNQLECEPINNDFSFYDFFLNIEDRNIKETFSNNQDWFGKEIPLELIDDMYKRTIKGVKKDSKPKFSFKLPIIKGKIQCQIYDQNNVCVDINKLTPDCELIFVLHIRGLKFLKQHYYCDCYVSQIKIFIPRDEKYNIFDKCVIEDDEIREDDIDIIDEEILNEIKEKEKKENLKIERKQNLEHKILELTKELDNL